MLLLLIELYKYFYKSIYICLKIDMKIKLYNYRIYATYKDVWNYTRDV